MTKYEGQYYWELIYNIAHSRTRGVHVPSIADVCNSYRNPLICNICNGNRTIKITKGEKYVLKDKLDCIFKY